MDKFDVKKIDGVDSFQEVERLSACGWEVVGLIPPNGFRLETYIMKRRIEDPDSMEKLNTECECGFTLAEHLSTEPSVKHSPTRGICCDQFVKHVEPKPKSVVDQIWEEMQHFQPVNRTDRWRRAAAALAEAVECMDWINIEEKGVTDISIKALTRASKNNLGLILSILKGEKTRDIPKPGDV